MLLAIFLIFVIFTVYTYYRTTWLLIILVVILVTAFLKVSKINKFILIISSVLFIIFTFNNYQENDLQLTSNYYEVIEVKNSYSVLKQNDQFFLFYYNDLKLENKDVLEIKGEHVNITNSFNDFYNYLNKQKINYLIEAENVNVIKLNKDFFGVLLKKITSNTNGLTKSYFNLFLFNQKEALNKEIFQQINLLSSSHLLVISGLHITLLFQVLEKIFKKLRLAKVRTILSCLILVPYLHILNFAVSSLRAFLFYIFKKINKRFDFALNNVDILSLIGISFLILSPKLVFTYGFIYSFVFSFALLFINPLYETKTKLNKSLNVSFCVFLISIPILLLSNYELNVLTLLFIIVLSWPLKSLFIFSWLALFLPKLQTIYTFTIKIFTDVISFLQAKSVYLIFGKPSIIFVILYYLILIFYFLAIQIKQKENKYIIVLGLLLCFKYFQPHFNFNERVTFLNVGQGDCSILFIPNSKKVVLIDTGGSRYEDVAMKKIIPFLKRNGINVVDKVIISHDDFDHNGALPSLINNFKVKEVINDSLITHVNIGKQKFINLNINNKRDNDGSIVLYGNYAYLNFLFTGDISSKVEETIINKFDVKIDVLKVAHHGSKTSTSETLLKQTKPSFAVISYGKNFYGHPHKDIIKRLQKYKVIYYETYLHNNITFSSRLFGGFHLKLRD